MFQIVFCLCDKRKITETIKWYLIIGSQEKLEFLERNFYRNVSVKISVILKHISVHKINTTVLESEEFHFGISLFVFFKVSEMLPVVMRMNYTAHVSIGMCLLYEISWRVVQVVW